MITYIYDRPDWPKFRWDQKKLEAPLASVRHHQGKLIGRMEGLGFQLRDEAMLQTLTLDVLKSSEIEGEILNPQQVRSSIARRLNMNIAGLVPAERHVEGVVKMLLDATQDYKKKLTKERLFNWHRALFPAGRSGLRKITVGNWRDDREGPMQVISGPIGHERVYFEAPPASRLEREMTLLLDWLNDENQTDLVLKSCIAHLWFVTLHPFEDGNGRIGRAIADMLLARSEQSPQRFYSMSAQIRNEREGYYGGLEKTQKGDLDITECLQWFLGCLEDALTAAERALAKALKQARFWEQYRQRSFNDRQRKVLNKLLNDFEGKLTSSKWAKLTQCSHDTALRDINDLVEQGILAKDAAGGRSTSYSLADFGD